MADTRAASLTPWCDLPPEYTTDKIPPGWYVRWSMSLEMYTDALDDWNIMASYETSKSMTSAMRLRLKGTVKEFIDANKVASDDRSTDHFDRFIKTIKANFVKTVQGNIEFHCIEFSKYQRKRDETVQVYTATQDRLFTKAKEGR